MANADTFNQSGADIEINKTKNIINSNCNTYNTAYGSVIIDPSKYKVYAWTFKILKCSSNHSGINIGITDISSSCIDANFARSKSPSNDSHFSYCSWGKKYSYNYDGEKYLGRYRENDLISMKLDFDGSTEYGSLYFHREKITDNTVQYAFDTRKPYKIAFDQILKTRKYKMAVSIKNASVESFDFIKKWPSTSSISSKSKTIQKGDIPSILKSPKNGDKECKQKKRVRFIFDKNNRNDGDNVVDEEPLRKKRKMNKNEDDEEEEDEIEILPNINLKKKDKKLSLEERLKGIYEKNRRLIIENKRLNNKCNEYEDKYKKYEKERKQILERLKEHEMKIKELEKSNDKYRDIMTKMISIIGPEDDKNEEENGNKCNNAPEVVVIDGGNDDMDISNNDDDDVVHINNKNKDKENGDLDICAFCKKKGNQIFYCVECRNVNCNNNECKLQHENMHKKQQDMNRNKNQQKERRKKHMNNNHNVGNNVNNQHSMIHAMGTTNNIINMNNYIPPNMNNYMPLNPMQQLLIAGASMPYNTMQRVGTMPPRYPTQRMIPKPLRNGNNVIPGGNIGNPIVLDAVSSSNK